MSIRHVSGWLGCCGLSLSLSSGHELHLKIYIERFTSKAPLEKLYLELP